MLVFKLPDNGMAINVFTTLIIADFFAAFCLLPTFTLKRWLISDAVRAMRVT